MKDLMPAPNGADAFKCPAQHLHSAPCSQLPAILSHLPCGLTVFDATLELVFSNDAVRDMLAPEGSSIEVDVGHVLRNVARRSKAGPQTLRLHGRVIEVRGNAMPDGGIVTMYADKTAEHEALAELATSEDRLARALEASGLGLWESDLETGEVYVSRGWSSMLGLGEQDVQVSAASVDACLPPEGRERERIFEARRRLVKGEIDTLSLEHRFARADGTSSWLHTSAQVSKRAPDGRALRVVGTCADITERMEAAVALEAARQAADEASRAKSDFLATISHELRTPLNGVVGLAHLLRGADLPPMEHDAVAMIDNCAKSLLSLVDNVLDLSRIEAGRLTIDEGPVDLSGLVNEVADVFTVRAQDKGIHFTLSVEPSLPDCIHADGGRLRQILLNLLANALKFTSAGGFSLAVRRAVAAAQPTLELEVRDSGIGIAPEDQARLFQRFTQVDSTRTRRYGGSGLGLAISRELAQLMQGDIELRSSPGSGSSFTLRIPLVAVARPEAAAAVAQVRDPAEARILVAEDNPVNRLVIQRLLKSQGYTQVTVVEDGLQAVQACEQSVFDLVLMDCQMPIMDGLEATQELRRRGFGIPILALTASAVAGDRERCIAAGMDDYLTKPIEPAKLALRLQQWLEAAPAADTLPAPLELPCPAFEPDTLDYRFAGDVELFSECRNLFVRHADAWLHELEAAWHASDLAALARVAHKLRGAAANVGAAKLARLCAAAEGGDSRPSQDWLASAATALSAYVRESAAVELREVEIH